MGGEKGDVGWGKEGRCEGRVSLLVLYCCVQVASLEQQLLAQRLSSSLSMEERGREAEWQIAAIRYGHQL